MEGSIFVFGMFLTNDLQVDMEGMEKYKWYFSKEEEGWV